MAKAVDTVQKRAIGIIGPVPANAVAALNGYDIVEISAEELSAGQLTEQAKKLALLIVGGDYRPLKAVLPALRTALPNLTVVALADSLDRASQNFYRNHVDGLYELPADADKLAVAVSSVNSETAASGWRLAAKEKVENGLLTMVIAFSLWWLAVALFNPPPYLLPSPTSVLAAFFLQADRFLLHLGTTAYEAGLGFIAGNTLGMAIAISLHRYVGLKKLTLPVLISFQAIPVVALAPMLVVWFGTGLASKATMAAIICFFPMVVNSLQAFSGVDREYVELFEFYKASFAAKLRMLLIPASFQAIIAALKISAGLSVVGAIVAELTGAGQGLGYVLLNASYRLETDVMFVSMLLSAILGIVFYQLPSLLRLVVPRSWSTSLT